MSKPGAAPPKCGEYDDALGAGCANGRHAKKCPMHVRPIVAGGASAPEPDPAPPKCGYALWAGSAWFCVLPVGHGGNHNAGPASEGPTVNCGCGWRCPHDALEREKQAVVMESEPRPTVKSETPVEMCGADMGDDWTCDLAKPCSKHSPAPAEAQPEAAPHYMCSCDECLPPAPLPEVRSTPGMLDHVWLPGGVCSVCGRHREDEGIRGCNPVRSTPIGKGEVPEWAIAAGKAIEAADFEGETGADDYARLIFVAYQGSAEARKLVALQHALVDAIETASNARTGSGYYGTVHLPAIGPDQIERWRRALSAPPQCEIWCASCQDGPAAPQGEEEKP